MREAHVCGTHFQFLVESALLAWGAPQKIDVNYSNHIIEFSGSESGSESMVHPGQKTSLHHSIQPRHPCRRGIEGVPFIRS
jgi:hypothetical protein